jgi:hypothetical protein
MFVNAFGVLDDYDEGSFNIVNNLSSCMDFDDTISLQWQRLMPAAVGNDMAPMKPRDAMRLIEFQTAFQAELAKLS